MKQLTQMHKVQRQQIVNKYYLFIYSFINLINFGFSQNILNGTYSLENINKNVVLDNVRFRQYKFLENGTFTLITSNNVNFSVIGEGHYIIKDSILILNYDLTELKKESYHKSEKYFNSNDSIKIKLNIYNFNKKPLFDIQTWSFLSNKPVTLGPSAESNKNGVAVLLFKKKKKRSIVEIHVDGEYFAKHILYIDLNANYNIDVYMSKTDIYGFGHPRAIKNELLKFKVIDIKDAFFKIKDRNGKVEKWIKYKP